ncbi:TPA: AraC family transcriptional regulator [Escherichia coli]
MATTCSVILILESFDVYFGKESVFLDRGLSVLVDSSYRDFFLTYPERVIVADFGAEFISRYLKANNLRGISDCREYPSYLKINFADFSLIKGLISWANHCAEYIEIFDESIAFTCLSAFSSEKQFGVFLFGCLKSTGAKVKTIIHTDLSAPWHLKDISSRLYLSESLLKRKLKEEGVSFSKILLDERMQMAEYLLSTRCYPISKVAKVCGYASVSYFTYVFRRYFGVSPSQYSQRSSESKILTHQGI